MNIWSTEIKELNQINQSIKGKHSKLEKELQSLIKSDDANILLVYSRRCLEVIITELCERELKRHRGTEPLQRIIDKLNKEEIVPHNIVVSMQSVNSMSTFGAHPKEFEMEQVKPVLHNLKTILKWYMNYAQEKGVTSEIIKEKTKAQTNTRQSKSKSGKRMILVTGILLAAVVVAITLKLLNFNGKNNTAKAASIGSIVVLPISNFTGQDSLDWLVDGMQASLIQDIQKVSRLRIPGVTTSQTFKNSNKTIKEITSECNTDAALEMDLICMGEDSICVQTRLITGDEEKQLWTADYRIAKNEILNWYNGVTKQIVKEVNVELTPQEERLLSKSRTIDKQVYEDYLKAHQYWGDFRPESLYKAMDYLNNAIKQEPDWAPLYAGLAQTWGVLYQAGLEISIAPTEIDRNLNKALELDPNLPEAHYLKALNAHLAEWDWEKSEREFLAALAINPNDAESRALYGQLLCVLQRGEEGLAQGRLALELDPLNPYVKIWSGGIMLWVGDCKTALTLAEEVDADDPGNMLANSAIWLSAYKCKDYDKAIKAEKYNLSVFYNVKEDDLQEIERIYKEQGIAKAYEKITEHLERYAENNPAIAFELAMDYCLANQPEKALDWLEQGYEMHLPTMTYIAIKGSNFEPLFNNPRFIAICEKMNLPLPKTNQSE